MQTNIESLKAQDTEEEDDIDSNSRFAKCSAEVRAIADLLEELLSPTVVDVLVEKIQQIQKDPEHIKLHSNPEGLRFSLKEHYIETHAPTASASSLHHNADTDAVQEGDV